MNNNKSDNDMTASGPVLAMRRRRPASEARLGGSKLVQAARMNLFMLVRILFQYLERVDEAVLFLAKEVLKDCERKHNNKDSKYETLADAISERVRDAVGETHWARARQIQKQLALNNQRRKMRAMEQARRKRSEQLKVWESLQERAENASGGKADAMNSSETSSSLGCCRDEEMQSNTASSGDENIPAPRQDSGDKHRLRIHEDPKASSSEGDMSGGAAEGGSHPPPRKRVMFAPPPDPPKP